MAWLVDEDEDPDIIILSSSPIISNQLSRRETVGDDSIEFVGFSGTAANSARHLPQDPDDSIEFVETEVIKPSVQQRRQQNSKTALLHKTSDPAESIEFIMANSIPARNMAESSKGWLITSPLPKPRRGFGKNSMLPPMLPQHISAQPYSIDEAMPEPSFPVRPIIKQARKRLVVPEELESPILEMPPSSQRRLHRRTDSPLANNGLRKERPRKRPKVDLRFNPAFDSAAVHSGDETSEGSSHDEDDVESESDRLFLEEMPETQVSPSYDQTLAYRQSLFTQAPAGAKAPAFAKPPTRPYGAFGNGTGSSRPRLVLSSSPLRDNSEPDEYVFGSFVVDDDADVSYLSDEPSVYAK